MKLELKHIAPYLPYGLKYVPKHNEDDIQLLSIGMLHPQNIESVKPILRPLSDLTEVIEHEGKEFVPLRVLWKEKYPHDGLNKSYSKTKCDVEEMPYSFLLRLFEWHFDVFGLIPEGLAIEKK